MERTPKTERYFRWICKKIQSKRYASHERLLTHLFEKTFTYILDRDGNRYEDGIALRYRYGSENGFSDARIASELDVFQCSVLEMMVALAIRCEESIMSDSEIGNRSERWFWSMVESLGLIDMDDRYFDRYVTDDILTRFLDREYEPDGRGGLFVVNDPPRDMRDVEIWYQAMWYFNEIT